MSGAHRREEALFEAALRLPTEERSAWLAKACGEDASLRESVEGLLLAHEKAGSFLADTPAGPTVQLKLPAEEGPGAAIGRYKLLEKVGEGGFGVVYVAEQREPVRRRVALKIIKLGMDTRQVVARFEAERQALALMDHPNIAKVLDAGSTETGRPFFVMELVRGVRLTDYCDQNKLPPDDRLGLFIKVCQAIQHAHQKGIIHRDIKPSNILVTLHDGVPIPKVIDFGIAKATQGELTDKTVYTQFQQFIGTPAYMSPEQAEMSGLDVDTRGDIYSLGVLLYELLTGRTPFDQKELLEAGLDGMRKMIREMEPVRPSTRVNSLQGEDRTTTAQRRGGDAPKLIHLLRGDLDWIVMKCLEKDRTRRYETANGLAMDLQRYLGNEPVAARPPSKLYRFQKAVRRNKLAFAAVTAVTTALVAGLGTSSWMFLKEKRARQRAVAAEKAENQLRHSAEQNEKRATTEAVKSRQIARFLQDMLNSVGPTRAQGEDTRMLQKILDETVDRLGADLKGQPLVEAELRRTLGKVYYDLGEYAKAERMHRQSLDLYSRETGPQHEVPVVMNHLGLTLLELGQLKQAEEVLKSALEKSRALFGPIHTNVAASLFGLAMVAWRHGDLVQAEAKLREELEMHDRLGKVGMDVAGSIANLGLVCIDRGNVSEAEPLFRRALAMNLGAGLADKHPEILRMQNNLALALWYQGKLEQAGEIQHRALEVAEKILPPNHLDLSVFCNNVALVLRDQGNLAQAETYQRRAYEIATKTLAPKDPTAIHLRNNLAIVLRRRGAASNDVHFLEEALSIHPTDPLTADGFHSLLAKPSLNQIPFNAGASTSLWRYTNSHPGSNWMEPGLDDRHWPSAPLLTGSHSFFPHTLKTAITVHTNLWLRREFHLTHSPTGLVTFRISRNHDAEIWVNGVRAAPVVDWSDTETLVPCFPAAQAALRLGRNVLALRCVEADGGAPIEVDIYSGPPATVAMERLIERVGRLIDQEPQRGEAYAARAQAFARLGEWSKAIPDLDRACELNPETASYRFQLAALLIKTGDQDGYRRLRETALSSFTEPPGTVVAQQIAELALLLPLPEPHLSKAIKLADEAAAVSYADWNLPCRQLTKGLADYRQDKFAQAIEWTTKALQSSTQKELPAWNHERQRNRTSAAGLVQAMAQHRLGRSSEARAALQEASSLIETGFPASSGYDQGREWPDMLIARLLLEEAKTLIDGVTAKTSKSD